MHSSLVDGSSPRIGRGAEVRLVSPSSRHGHWYGAIVSVVVMFGVFAANSDAGIHGCRTIVLNLFAL